MKVLLIIVLLVGLVYGHEVPLRKGIVPKKLPPLDIASIPVSSWDQIREGLLSKGSVRDGFIEANVTEYAQKVISHIQTLIIESGLDPLELSNQTIHLLPTGTLTLTHGYVEDISTLTTYDSVVARYSPSSKVLELTLPLAFKDFLISYDYVTKIVLISIKGDVKGTVKNVKLDLHLGFNFTNDHAFVDKADVKNTGSIKIALTGLGLLDWIIDLLTDTLIVFFHGIILSIINRIIDNPVDDIVELINKAIDEFLKKNVTLI